MLLIILLTFVSFGLLTGNDEITNKVHCTTTKGELTIEIYRDWSPLGADRFIELVEDGFFNEIAFFRCVGGFLTQCTEVIIPLP